MMLRPFGLDHSNEVPIFLSGSSQTHFLMFMLSGAITSSEPLFWARFIGRVRTR